ncbi:beta-1,4-galactosyltransferase 1-like isoform X2 [Brachyhypopomus gauderio]|uniref:beta-1,4-galactosyltransferase 1-like isoform X2 n=1 Tax=Brachyhypopomus gauderio TaxID=698409 RepID=UPI00404143D1
MTRGDCFNETELCCCLLRPSTSSVKDTIVNFITLIRDLLFKKKDVYIGVMKRFALVESHDSSFVKVHILRQEHVFRNTKVMGESHHFGCLGKICNLVVALGALHISVMALYYWTHSGSDDRVLRVQAQRASPQRETTGPDLEPPARATVALTSARATADAGVMEERRSGDSSGTEASPTLEKCLDTSPRLVGPLRVEFSDPVDLDLIRQEPLLMDGGHYKPSECLSVQKVALIIPFRHREQHLKYWLNYLHPILQRQQLDYGVYVIEQDGEETFNRAKLMNVGYAEALKEYDYDCFVFSDVDIIPMDDRNTYRCYEQPRHLSVAMDKFGYGLPYYQYFGGVSAMSKDQYLKINGFPNNYWGWGGEDDDIFNRKEERRRRMGRPSRKWRLWRRIRLLCLPP